MEKSKHKSFEEQIMYLNPHEASLATYEYILANPLREKLALAKLTRSFYEKSLGKKRIAETFERNNDFRAKLHELELGKASVLLPEIKVVGNLPQEKAECIIDQISILSQSGELRKHENYEGVLAVLKEIQRKSQILRGVANVLDNYSLAKFGMAALEISFRNPKK